MGALISSYIFSPLLKWLVTSAGIGTICLLLFWFTPAWLPSKLRGTLLVAGVGLLSVGAFATYFFRAGENHMAQRIAAKDKAAIARVIEGAKEVDACNGGIDWDVTVGQCVPGSGANVDVE